MNSREKGKRGEREVVHLFKRNGFNAHRTAQVDGRLTSDVLVDARTAWHAEVKRPARFAGYKYIEQAVRDAKEGGRRFPIVFVRADKEEQHLVMMRAQDWFDLLEEERFFG